MQPIGYLDRNGKEICEGDTLRELGGTKSASLWQVTWDERGFYSLLSPSGWMAVDNYIEAMQVIASEE